MLMASRTGFAWSNKLINRLVLFSINTGSLTALCACCSLLFVSASVVFRDQLLTGAKSSYVTQDSGSAQHVLVFCLLLHYLSVLFQFSPCYSECPPET